MRLKRIAEAILEKGFAMKERKEGRKRDCSEALVSEEIGYALSCLGFARHTWAQGR